MLGFGDRLEEQVQLDLRLLWLQFYLLLSFGIGCRKWESIVLHWMWEVGKGVRLVVTPAIQCSFGCCCCCCGTRGQTSS